MDQALRAAGVDCRDDVPVPRPVVRLELGAAVLGVVLGHEVLEREGDARVGQVIDPGEAYGRVLLGGVRNGAAREGDHVARWDVSLVPTRSSTPIDLRQ